MTQYYCSLTYKEKEKCISNVCQIGINPMYGKPVILYDIVWGHTNLKLIPVYPNSLQTMITH